MSELPLISSGDFAAFFNECWGHDPFPWQANFARRVSTGDWPRFVCAPTGSGKTGCLDAALFALALQASQPAETRTAGRRIFFIVNRRVIVDEAYQRAQQLAEKLASAPLGTVTANVAARLRFLTGEADAAPLTCTQLRGGVYRDRSWARSLLQPMIVCSTVDQVGSRLLFRGYGVSPCARPIHAALVAQDSLLLLDEAHISRPFVETLEWVRRYRLHQPSRAETVALPFQFIQMTATPPADTADSDRVDLTDTDRQHPVLKKRLECTKLAALRTAPKAKGKARDKELAAKLVEEATAILKEHHPRSLAVMVNRVAVARDVHKALLDRKATLLIGRMRPLDRDEVTKSLQTKLKIWTAVAQEPAAEDSSPVIVVSTQCLEVGADFDFDALVTEAASLDALRQRFGRLNRGGHRSTAHAVIVLPADQEVEISKLTDEKPADPIYGNAIPRTWHFLQCINQDGAVDFGLTAMTAKVGALPADERALLMMPSPHAPVLLPAYLDCWVQTNPAPAADPDVGIFLHGPQRDMAEVQVCWRADLPASIEEPNDCASNWAEVLSFCPPTSVECLPVPLHVMRQWLGQPQRKFTDESGDVGNAPPDDLTRELEPSRPPVLIWRGDESAFVKAPSSIRPGDTLVLRAQDGGWNALGHIPGAPVDPAEANEAAPLAPDELRKLDLGERGRALTHRSAVFRIHPVFLSEPAADTPAADLWKLAAEPDQFWTRVTLKETLREISSAVQKGWCSLTESQEQALKHFAFGKATALEMQRYPADVRAIVITSRHRLAPISIVAAFDEDSGDDSLSKSEAPQELNMHTRDVVQQIATLVNHLPLAPYAGILRAAADMHDWGKADRRFQAMLRMAAVFDPGTSALWAKSGLIPESRSERRAARKKAGLPDGFRHEMLSLQLAAVSPYLPDAANHRGLILHLIAAHHGFGRPFAPVVIDKAPPSVSIPSANTLLSLTSEARLAQPAYAMDSGVAENFWLLTRHHGWWGLALLETALRLADQQASAHPTSTA